MTHGEYKRESQIVAIAFDSFAWPFWACVGTRSGEKHDHHSFWPTALRRPDTCLCFGRLLSTLTKRAYRSSVQPTCFSAFPQNSLCSRW